MITLDRVPSPVHELLERYRGGYFRLCRHRSHRLGLPCFRLLVWGGFCGRHDARCGVKDCPWVDRANARYAKRQGRS